MYLYFVLLTIITLIILEYIYELLKFRSLIRLFHELLNKSNIMFMVGKINKLKYKDLIFLISDSDRANVIPKTMIFVNNIKNV